MQLKIKRGLKENLPELADGEFGFCTDTKELFVGSQNGNQLYGTGEPELQNISFKFNIQTNEFVGETEEEFGERFKKPFSSFLKSEKLGLINFKIKFRNEIYDYKDIYNNVKDPDGYHYSGLSTTNFKKNTIITINGEQLRGPRSLVNLSNINNSRGIFLRNKFSTDFYLNNFHYDENTEQYVPYGNKSYFIEAGFSFVFSVIDFKMRELINKSGDFELQVLEDKEGFVSGTNLLKPKIDFYFSSVPGTFVGPYFFAYEDVNYTEIEIEENEQAEFIIEWYSIEEVKWYSEYKNLVNQTEHALTVDFSTPFESSVFHGGATETGFGQQYKLGHYGYSFKDNTLLMNQDYILTKGALKSVGRFDVGSTANYKITKDTRNFVEVIPFPLTTNITITVPNTETEPYIPRGAQYKFVRSNTGTVSFVSETGGTTVNILSKNDLKNISVRYGVATLTKVNDSTWILEGDLS